MKRPFRLGMILGVASMGAGLSTASCTDSDAPSADAGVRDATIKDAPTITEPRDALPPLAPDAMLEGSYCALPGSLVATAQGMAIVAGGDPS
ncbi:MAG TPA: hypothetical protein VII82_10935, partial [Polyangiaceae bacterium]